MNLPVESRDQGLIGWWFMVALVVAGFIVCAYGMLRLATDPGWQDTEAYLGHSLYVAEHGGWLGFLRESFTGVFPITERHPLYMLVLAPFASRAAEFFHTAKVIDLITGVVVLVTLVWMVMRRYGKGPALIAGFLYAMSSTLLAASSHVNHESLFAFFTLLTWWFLTEPVRTHAGGPSVETQAPPPGEREPLPPWRRWAIAGVFLGLAYLVKSPASLMGVSIVAAGLWYARLRFIASPRIYVLLLATAILASPLLVRNLIGFGTPVYEGVNTNIMWIDEWSDIGDEKTVMFYDRYGIMKVERNALPTAADYLATHSVGSIAKRLFKGIYTETFVVARKALGHGFDRGYSVAPLWGFAVLGFALVGWWLRRRSWDATFVFFWSAAFIVFFGWNHMFPEIRYLAPLVPVWIAFASYAIWQLGLRLLNRQLLWRLQAAVIAVIVLAVAGLTWRSGALTQPVPVLRESPSYASLLDWFNQNIEEGDRVLLGPTSEFYGLIWMVDRPISVVQTPNPDSLDGFQRYLRDRNVRYIVLNTENVYGEGRRLEADMAPYAEVSPDGALVEKQPLPGWRPVAMDPHSPRRYIIYESELVAQRSPK